MRVSFLSSFTFFFALLSTSVHGWRIAKTSLEGGCEVFEGLDVAMAAARRSHDIADWPAEFLVLTMADVTLTSALLNWLAIAASHGLSERVLVLSLDAETHAGLRAHGGLSVLTPESALEPSTRCSSEGDNACGPGGSGRSIRDPVGKRRKRGLWVKRMRLLRCIVGAGIDVLVSDIDAYWLRDPMPPVWRAAREGGGVDVVTSVTAGGTFLLAVEEQWGFLACMGFIYLRATPATGELLRLVFKRMTQPTEGNPPNADDQLSINLELRRLDAALEQSAAGAPKRPRPGAGERRRLGGQGGSGGSPTKKQLREMADRGLAFGGGTLRVPGDSLPDGRPMRVATFSHKEVLRSPKARDQGPCAGGLPAAKAAARVPGGPFICHCSPLFLGPPAWVRAANTSRLAPDGRRVRPVDWKWGTKWHSGGRGLELHDEMALRGAGPTALATY